MGIKVKAFSNIPTDRAQTTCYTWKAVILILFLERKLLVVRCDSGAFKIMKSLLSFNMNTTNTTNYWLRKLLILIVLSLYF
jgi:hypothetical protein